jgi:DNA-binding LacI/PurR family transcriptional regulator
MQSKKSTVLRNPRLHELAIEKIKADYVEKTKPGDRLPSESVLAGQYGVSVPTIREALRALTQMGFLDRRQGSGTYRCEGPKPLIAKSRGQGHERYIAIICPLDLTHGELSRYYIQVTLHLGKCLKKQGFRPQLYYGETISGKPFSFDTTQLFADVDRGLIAGAICIADDHQMAYKNKLANAGVAILDRINLVGPDKTSINEYFLRKAVGYLVARGRRKLACVSWQGANFLEKFTTIANELGAVTDKAWMGCDFHPNESGAGYSLMREMWGSGRVKPDALILADDVFFPDSALAISEMRIKVPEQMMVLTSSHFGSRMVAPFPVVQLATDSRKIAEAIALKTPALLNHDQAELNQPVIIDYLLIDPFANQEADVSVENS